MHVLHAREVLAPRHSLAERIPCGILGVECAVHLGQDQDLALARELNVDDVHVVVFALLRHCVSPDAAQVLLHAEEELPARHRQQKDGRDGHCQLAWAVGLVPEFAPKAVEPVTLGGGKTDILGQREEEEVVHGGHRNAVGVHDQDAVEGVVEKEGEELVEAAAVVKVCRVVLQTAVDRSEQPAVLAPLGKNPLAVRRGLL